MKRVWCRQKSQKDFSQLDITEQQKLNDLFADVGGLDSLHLDGVIDPGMEEYLTLPLDGKTTKPKLSWRQRLFGQPRN